MEAFEAAKKAGKVRFLGFSAHSVEAATALMDGYAFDTILFPVNYATWHAGSFGPQVLAKAKEKGMGILCLKAMAKGPWPEGAAKRYAKCWYEPLDTPETAAMGLRFTLSHPVTAAIPPGDETPVRHGPEARGRLRAALGRRGRGDQDEGPGHGPALPLPEQGRLRLSPRRSSSASAKA